ncbi:MAG: efflux RND transporter periplasmic adaptor subunit [Thermoanaerobaculia bacterium]
MDRPVEGKSRRGRTARWALAGGLLLLAVVAYPSLRRWMSSQTSVELSRIRVGEVTRGDLVREVAVQGNVVAAFSPTLVAPARGVVEVEVRAGEVVEAGAPLVTVKSPEVASRLEQERSTLLSLQADLERQRVQAQQSKGQNRQDVALLEVELEAARRALDRQETLRHEGLTNDVQYEEAQDDVRIAEMQLEAARQRTAFADETLDFEVRDRASRVERQRLVVTDLERQVEELTLRSPVEGLVSRVQANDRDAVTEGQPLVTVVDLSAFQVEAPVPEAYADEIAPGTAAAITYDGREWPATVASVAPAVEGSRVPVRVVFDEQAPESLKQNQRLSTRIILDTRHDVLKVPRGPFLEAGGGRTAYVLEDGLALRRPIEVGALSVSEVEIVAGLEEGDRIVVSDTGRFEGADRVLVR